MKKTENRLKTVVHSSKLSQKDFADSIGTTPATLSRQLNGVHKIDKQVALSIQAVYGINPDWLLTGEGEMFLGNSKNQTHGNNSPVITGNNNTVSYNLTKEEIELVESYRDGNGKKLLKLLAKLLATILLIFGLWYFWPMDTQPGQDKEPPPGHKLDKV